MSKDNHRGTGTSRRTALKAIGACAATATGVTSVASSRATSADEIYEEALRIKDRTGDVTEFREHLIDHGFGVGTTDISRTVGGQASSDGFTTNQYDKSEWNAYLTITQQCDGSGAIERYTVDFSWSFDDSFGDEIPADVAGIAWEGSDWVLKNDDYYSSDHHVNYAKSNPYGIAFTYEEYNGDPTALHGCGAYLEPDNDSSADHRQVFADYWHTFQDVDYSISISSGGVGISANPETDVVLWDRDHNQNRLVVSEADANLQCGV